MTPPDLPDDPGDWPTDPFALLGVTRGAGEVEIKRAYTRLIKRFKPDRAPDEFRRVREAYEACLEQFRWFAPPPDFPPPDPPAPPADEAPPADASPVRPPPTTADDHYTVWPAPVAAPAPDAIDSFWAEAVTGRDADGYAGLVTLADTRPDRPDVLLRLYWLLALNPALDAGRTRRDWLAPALVAARLAGPAAELYRRELEADPLAALHGPYRDLLAAPAAPRDLLAVARWRLAAAGRGGFWEPAETDLTALAGRLPFADEPGWLGYVAAALDWAAWDRPQPFYRRCRDELAGLRHLELSHPDASDRVEQTEHLAAAWRNVARSGPHDLFDLVPYAWAGTIDPAAAGPVLAAAAAAPGETLRRCDRAPEGLLLVLGRGLEAHWRARGGGDGPEFPPDLLRGLARALPRRRGGYAAVRGEVLDLLLAEAVHPLELAAACGDHPDPHARAVARPLRGDSALRVVWLAVRTHRG